MKNILLILPVIIITTVSNAQFKDIPYETKTKLKSNNLILGFINPKNFSINHTFSMSYGTYGDASVSLASYTATLSYQILKNLNISADVTMQYSPFAKIGSQSNAFNKEFQNSFNGINLSRVSLNYRPFKNMFISIDYYNIKNNYLFWDNYYNRWTDF
jgi:hypothetical protein